MLQDQVPGTQIVPTWYRNGYQVGNAIATWYQIGTKPVPFGNKVEPMRYRSAQRYMTTHVNHTQTLTSNEFKLIKAYTIK